MAQPMRECPVCEAIVLLDQDHCSICGHDLSLPAPEPAEEEPIPEVPSPPVSQELGSSDEPPTEPEAASSREGVSLFVGIVGFVAAALLIFWFVSQGGPLDDTDDDQPAVVGDDAAVAQVDLALAVCAGGQAGVAGAPSYSPSAGIHPTAIVVGDLATRDVATSTDLFPPEWVVDVSERPLDSSELLLCLSRTSSGEVDSVCASTTDPDALERLEADYRLRVYETATGDRLVDEPIGSEVFGPCPDPGSVDAGSVYAGPDPEDLVTLAVPLILGG